METETISNTKESEPTPEEILAKFEAKEAEVHKLVKQYEELHAQKLAAHSSVVNPIDEMIQRADAHKNLLLKRKSEFLNDPQSQPNLLAIKCSDIYTQRVQASKELAKLKVAADTAKAMAVTNKFSPIDGLGKFKEWLAEARPGWTATNSVSKSASGIRFFSARDGSYSYDLVNFAFTPDGTKEIAWAHGYSGHAINIQLPGFGGRTMMSGDVAGSTWGHGPGHWRRTSVLRGASRSVFQSRVTRLWAGVEAGMYEPDEELGMYRKTTGEGYVIPIEEN